MQGRTQQKLLVEQLKEITLSKKSNFSQKASKNENAQKRPNQNIKIKSAKNEEDMESLTIEDIEENEVGFKLDQLNQL